MCVCVSMDVLLISDEREPIHDNFIVEVHPIVAENRKETDVLASLRIECDW